MTKIDVPASDHRDWPDVASSTDAYAKRFAGGVGTFFLKTQNDEIIRRIESYKPSTLLEVGGGHGQVASSVVRQPMAITVTGSTAACEMRLQAALQDGDYDFVQTGLFPLPFDDNSFDMVTSLRMISHLSDWPRLIGELCRVAKTAVMVDFAPRSWASRYSETLLSAKKTLERDARPYLTQSLAEITDAFAGNKFRVEHVFRQFAIPMAIHRLASQAFLSSTAEGLLRRVGVTQLTGGPVIVTAVPEDIGAKH